MRKSVHRRADGQNPSRGGKVVRGGGSEEARGERADAVPVASSLRGMDVTGAKRLKALEAENQRLKKLLTEGDLDIEVLKEVAAKW
jgi:hypothetical protein